MESGITESSISNSKPIARLARELALSHKQMHTLRRQANKHGGRDTYTNDIV